MAKLAPTDETAPSTIESGSVLSECCRGDRVFVGQMDINAQWTG